MKIPQLSFGFDYFVGNRIDHRVRGNWVQEGEKIEEVWPEA